MPLWWSHEGLRHEGREGVPNSPAEMSGVRRDRQGCRADGTGAQARATAEANQDYNVILVVY